MAGSDSSHKERHLRFSAAFPLLLAVAVPVSLHAGVIDFEGFPDSTTLTTQYLGLTFSNAIILTAGISLNEFEFPPHSGINVVSDNNGPMSVSFATPVTSVSGFFTYAEPLTIDAFNASGTPVGQAVSLFDCNMALSGGPGSSPNELIQVGFAAGISSVTIIGDPAGGSFVMDDMTYTSGASAVPEPGALVLVLSGNIILVSLRRKR